MAKYTSANSSITVMGGVLHCYSQSEELDRNNTLDGFFTYARILHKDTSIPEGLLIFGMWIGGSEKTWYVFSVWDKEKETWWSQTEVKTFCNNYGLEYGGN